MGKVVFEGTVVFRDVPVQVAAVAGLNAVPIACPNGIPPITALSSIFSKPFAFGNFSEPASGTSRLLLNVDAPHVEMPAPTRERLTRVTSKSTFFENRARGKRAVAGVGMPHKYWC